jgi:glyoxalase/bleomycin resistance protein/dioxygenase superfamily protein
LGFQVDNVEETYSRLTKSYEGVINPFMEGQWKLAFLKDPDGNWIELGEIQKKTKKSKRDS